MRIALSVAVLIGCAGPAFAEKPPKIQYDPYTKTETIVGDDHSHMSILDEGFSGYWFSAAAVNGEMHNPVLMYQIDASDWYFINSAADIDGNQLNVIQGGRDVDTNASIHESFGVEMTPEYLRSHRSTGMNIKLMGSGGEKIIKVPPEVITTFDDVYERELSRFGGEQPVAAQQSTTPQITAGSLLEAYQAASEAGARTAAERGGLGISFLSTPAGLVLMGVAPGSVAAASGLKVGQVIVSANAVDLRGMPTAAALAVLKGMSKQLTFKLVDGEVVKVVRP